MGVHTTPHLITHAHKLSPWLPTSTTHSSESVHGAGAWAPGTQTREIEGHFNREHEPKDAVPIAADGGVPRVDFPVTEKIKEALTGHHSNSEQSTGASGGDTGLGHSTGTTDPGLAGSSGTEVGHSASGVDAHDSALSGTHGTQGSTKATHGISDVAQRQLDANFGNQTSTGNTDLASSNEHSITDKHSSVVTDRENVSRADGSVDGAHNTDHAEKDGKPGLVDKIKGAVHKN